MQDIIRTYFNSSGKGDMEEALSDGWKVVDCHELTDGIRNCLEYIIEKPDTANEENEEWISVEDQLPDDEYNHVIRDEDGEVYIGHYNFASKAFFVKNPDRYGYTKMCDITSWRDI